MEWIFKMIQPVIKDCETPEEAERKVKEWGRLVHPRNAFCGLIAVWYIEANWNEFKKRYLSNQNQHS